ncbi:unnamed protein product [Darwinula stevensoni]|uniref:Protein Wnt n=1 Tax=Darwinula stevensoni TaxID=69355 RepID=A0A7R8XJ38_9CRUS|nr:unnamed protein product [Darwinula stevensoni]CAG0894440.1 unnamed protein product [Darwinula stevensoni]
MHLCTSSCAYVGTREMAFVHAISAAGVAHAVTRACASGSLTTCGCDANIQGREHDRAFRWSGCSHNINYGSKFSKSFVDARELRSRKKFKKRNLDNGEEDDHRRRTSIILMNLHNNEAGRQVIQKNMKKECKCHGVSGSCELKTCWRVMPTFRQVGELLRDKYDGAVEVRGEPVGNEILLVPRNQQFKPQAREDLVYIKRSPDFCELDLKKGSLGTRGRSCNKGSRGIDGCDLLCCNRGYKTRRHKIAERCNCKFWWCCQVKCQTCEREIEIHTCL